MSYNFICSLCVGGCKRRRDVYTKRCVNECILLYGPKFICVLTNRHLSSGLSSERYNYCAGWEEWGLIGPKQPIYFSGLRGRLFHIRTSAAHLTSVATYLPQSVHFLAMFVNLLDAFLFIYLMTVNASS